eukprot:CAMPEP_0195006544 /NCGR_PEP_ID=MMETSP0326_2-20130528/6808_1 /TAXON_ID=2866 ORGANISM="Crypthecodinium cohnii, Strain Seligo" /NCGR_SAMPLE_ID=MMETSP0326_2 /ASSEMBLY_ACC=CAM_ASM_000348 /LENGTH=40 /DNA_ID= /DNA_START= /DNA_END= /DNA_ORIENTATION=
MDDPSCHVASPALANAAAAAAYMPRFLPTLRKALCCPKLW